MKTLNEIDFEAVDGDTLGDAYEYLIGEFASESGKKQVSSIPHKLSLT